MERSRRLQQQQHRGRDLRLVIKIMACGGMVGTAILFPLAVAEGLWLRALTLAIFIPSALGFHALHLQPFIRFGSFTFAPGLVLLLVAALAAGSSRKDLVPWLPLFIACLSLITVAIDEMSMHDRPRPVPTTTRDYSSDVSIDTLTGRSIRTMSTQLGPQHPLDSNRLDDVYFARHGPSSRTSRRTGTEGTDISLSSVVGLCRPHWDVQTRSHFPEAMFARPGSRDEPQTRRISPEMESSPDQDSDFESDQDTAESSHPLLGPQGGPIAQSLA